MKYISYNKKVYKIKTSQYKMNKRLLLATLIIVLVIGVVILIRVGPTESEKSIESQTEGSIKMVSASELSQHNSKEDCWVVFEGKVYDLTDFIPRHPGGEDKIIPQCGSPTKFEQAFLGQHGRSKVDFFMKVGVLIGDLDVVGSY